MHELNIILPGIKDDYLEKEEKKEKKQQLYWAGIVGLKENTGLNGNDPNEFLKKDLEIFIGGEARYGFGRIILESKEGPFKEIPDKWNSKKILKNYYPVENKNKAIKEGKLELLIEIQESWKQAELKVTSREDRLFYVPGSVIEQGLNYKMITKGIFST